MSRRAKVILGLALVLAVASVVYVWFSPLAMFTRRISHADRAVVTMPPSYGVVTPVSITITGEDLRRVIEMVSSGHRDRKNYDCALLANVKFFRGSEMLGEMRMCNKLMSIGRRQYRDDTGLLESLIASPLLEEYRRSWVPPAETK